MEKKEMAIKNNKKEYIIKKKQRRVLGTREK